MTMYLSTATATVDYTKLTLILMNGEQTVTHLYSKRIEYI